MIWVFVTQNLINTHLNQQIQWLLFGVYFTGVFLHLTGLSIWLSLHNTLSFFLNIFFSFGFYDTLFIDISSEVHTSSPQAPSKFFVFPLLNLESLMRISLVLDSIISKWVSLHVLTKEYQLEFIQKAELFLTHWFYLVKIYFHPLITVS